MNGKLKEAREVLCKGDPRWHAGNISLVVRMWWSVHPLPKGASVTEVIDLLENVFGAGKATP